MAKHQALIHALTQELYSDDAALALILYGSLSRNEETANSDIDLFVIRSEYYLQKRHHIRDGITVEYLEMHMDFVRNFIEKREVPVLFTLANGVVLFDKAGITEDLQAETRKILDDGPPANPKWSNERYTTKRRYDLSEIYFDLLDIDDETAFNYVATLLMHSAIPLMLENKKAWPTTRKKTMDLLKTRCDEGYQFLEVLLGAEGSLAEKREAAKGLVDYSLAPYGGLLAGDAVVFRVEVVQ